MGELIPLRGDDGDAIVGTVCLQMEIVGWDSLLSRGGTFLGSNEDKGVFVAVREGLRRRNSDCNCRGAIVAWRERRHFARVFGEEDDWGEECGGGGGHFGGYNAETEL